LEGKQARTVFVSNYGFGDMLQLARQTRPQLYALDFPPVVPPVESELCLETGGRLGADGSVLMPLGETEVDELLAAIKSLKPEAVAINLLFSFLDDQFERKLEAAIRGQDPSLFVSRSSKVLPQYKEYERGIATWLNASLAPAVSGYLQRLQLELGGKQLQLMQSSGETIAAHKAVDSAVNLLLSGPAGGLTAIAYIGEQVGENKVISFDMGGTSTDVALLDGHIATTTEASIGNYPVAVPMVDMHTIGAGGGSIARLDSLGRHSLGKNSPGMMQVGPNSAGADPGPACYGKGGTEATVTDANVVLGRLQADSPLAGSLQLSHEKAVAAILPLAEKIELSVEETALGIIAIANEHMAKAIRLISVNRGYDPKDFLLASFGGAGGLHVCAIADAMQMHKAIVPVHSGVLSALGMTVAHRGRQFSRTLPVNFSQIDEAELGKEFAKLEQFGIDELCDEGLEPNVLDTTRSVDMRFSGQSYTLNVRWKSPQQALEDFQALHIQRYGYAHQANLELVNIRVNVVANEQHFDMPTAIPAPGCNKLHFTKVYGDANDAKVLARAELKIGEKITGPAVITEYSATTFIESSWVGEVDQLGNLLLEKQI